MTVISAAHIAGTGKSASTNRSAWAPNLLALPGCGPLMAAKIIAETAGVCGSKSKAAAFARADGFNKCEMAGPPTSRSRRFRDRTDDLPLSVTWSPGTPGMRENPLLVARRGRSFLAQRRPSSVWGADSRAAHCCHDYEGPTLLPSHCGSCGRALVVIGPAHMVGAAGPMNCPGLARLLLHRECGDRARQPLPGSLQCCSYR